jgi:hypothetical protein
MSSRRAGPPWPNPLEPGRRRKRPRGRAGVLAAGLIAVVALLAAAFAGTLSPIGSAAAVVAVVAAAGAALARLS